MTNVEGTHSEKPIPKKKLMEVDFSILSEYKRCIVSYQPGKLKNWLIL